MGGQKRKADSGNVAAGAKKGPGSVPGPGWEELNRQIEAGDFLGNFGGQNGCYQAVAEAQEGKDLNEHHCKRHPDEFMVPELMELINDPKTRKRWDECISINPNGMVSSRPTISATYARMDLPELSLVKDGNIVMEDGSIKIIKAGIEPVWNLPRIAHRLKMSEEKIRSALKKYTQIPDMDDTSKAAFLPPIGGCTVYFFGNPALLRDPKTEVAIRCHDECNGSDVFCTDICTCRPYLLFAIQGAVECAQRGGVGLVAYFRKEGRGLGEVTKYRVYNARKNQAGGDRPEMYFKQTENIAGIRDARLQELMPDVLTWLGIKRIDWLMSMSSEKYDAIVAAKIKVLQRVSLPDDMIPRDANVEISAKVAAGYHLEGISSENKADHVLRLQSIRERCHLVYKYVKEDKSQFFSIDESKLDDAAAAVVSCYKSQYKSPEEVPYHSRARHFELPNGEDLLQGLYEDWKYSDIEKARRLLDLTVVSVLNDAGAGTAWSYMDKNRETFSRSEGLAIATYEMFLDGLFSSDAAVPHRCNSLALKNLDLKSFSKGMQHTDTNLVNGLQGRLQNLHNLGAGMDAHPDFFGEECARPGNMADYVLSHSKGKQADGLHHISVEVLWKVVIEGLAPCWPARNKVVHGISHGDVWQLSPLKEPGHPFSDMVPFHKLPQWLMYSLIEIFERFLEVKFTDIHLLTGLAEYRNGGLFMDSGVLQLKNESTKTLTFDVGSEIVVEWRALTIVLLDRVADIFRKQLNVTAEEFPTAKVLQAGTWQAGRNLAKAARKDGSPPLRLRLDGTVF